MLIYVTFFQKEKGETFYKRKARSVNSAKKTLGCNTNYPRCYQYRTSSKLSDDMALTQLMCCVQHCNHGDPLSK